MKNLFMIMIIALSSLTTYGQGHPDIYIRNDSPCTVYYRLLLDNTIIPCAGVQTSSVITIAPGTSVSYNNTTYPGVVGAGGGNFVRSVIYDGPTSCITASADVGEVSCGFNMNGSLSLVQTAMCASCAFVNIKWTPAPPGGTMSTLHFY